MKIWRLGQIDNSWQIFRNQKKLSFYWLDVKVDYTKVKNIKSRVGWTCIRPWVEEVKKGDLVFIINKTEYAGVAIAKDAYRYEKNDINSDPYYLPGIPVKFIHSLSFPIHHGLKIEAIRPKTFYRINGIGFDLYKVMKFIKSKYPNVAFAIEDYLIKNGKPESNKISRICWNDNEYKSPSGRNGKISSDDSFEGINGFGFEEWLNVKSRLINGYHYSFLQPLGVISNGHVDKIYNIALIKNDIQGKRYLTGIIKNAICISKEESIYAYKVYKKNKWIVDMAREIDHVKGNSIRFLEQEPQHFFNIKYNPKNIRIFEELNQIPDYLISTYRYKLLDFLDENLISNSNDNNNLNEGNYKSILKIKRKGSKDTSFDPIHSKMQNELVKLLRHNNSYEKVLIERNRVDIKAKTRFGTWHYYEIKTNNPKKSIRNALGQIMEYAYWPGLRKAEKLIIISDEDPDPYTKKYMKYLRENFNLHVYYQSFKLPNILGELV